MEIKKENVLQEFITMMENSWTYQKMTKEEKERLINVLNDVRTQEALKGACYYRWHILQSIYHAYLIGIGYDSFNWRDENDD